MYPRAYILSIVHSLIIDRLRRNKPIVGLPLDEYGEITQGRIWASSDEDTMDPACEFERKVRYQRCVTQVVRDIASLPVCQRNAMICLLKDEVEDIQPLADEFRKYGIDIAVLHWPNEKKQLISCKASLSIARKKMRLSKRTYMDIN